MTIRDSAPLWPMHDEVSGRRAWNVPCDVWRSAQLRTKAVQSAGHHSHALGWVCTEARPRPWAGCRPKPKPKPYPPPLKLPPSPPHMPPLPPPPLTPKVRGADFVRYMSWCPVCSLCPKSMALYSAVSPTESPPASQDHCLSTLSGLQLCGDMVTLSESQSKRRGNC